MQKEAAANLTQAEDILQEAVELAKAGDSTTDTTLFFFLDAGILAAWLVAAFFFIKLQRAETQNEYHRNLSFNVNQERAEAVNALRILRKTDLVEPLVKPNAGCCANV